MANRKPTIPDFTGQRVCSHCHNAAPHRVIHRHANLQTNFHEAVGDYSVGFVFVMIGCPACGNVTLLREHWHTGKDDAIPEFEKPPVGSRQGWRVSRSDFQGAVGALFAPTGPAATALVT